MLSSRCLQRFVLAAITAFATCSVSAVDVEGEAEYQLEDLLEHEQVEESKTDIQEKAYRQALFFYFQGHKSQALSQLSTDKNRIGFLNEKAALFEAGLQVSLGLPVEAQQALIRFVMQTELDDEYNYRRTAKIKTDEEILAQQKELLLIALLQLAEQKIKQGDLQLAQNALAKISEVPIRYVDQYKVLSQLAYWPTTPDFTQVSIEQIENKPTKDSAFVTFNQALRHLQQSEDDQAENKLQAVKVTKIEKVQPSFWQELFAESSDGGKPVSGYQLGTDQDTQALNDYARLVLGKMYVEQSRYQAAFDELAEFPQDSLYAESALFLYAYAALKAGEHDIALSLWQYQFEQYPDSSLAWQAGLLAAKRLSETKPLIAFKYYQILERALVNQQNALYDFSSQYNAQTDILIYLSEANEQSSHTVNANEQAVKSAEWLKAVNSSSNTSNNWLAKALLSDKLAAQFKQLQELDVLTKTLAKQQKQVDWLADTIELNKKRQANIQSKNQTAISSENIEQLLTKRNELADKVKSALAAGANEAITHRTFADEAQQDWFNRIDKSRAAIELIKSQKNTEDYQQRLKRVSGVLAWQASEQYSERAWQYQKLLKQVDSALLNARQQQQKVKRIARKNDKTVELEQRLNEANKRLTNLKLSVASLRSKTTSDVSEKVNVFIAEQQSVLADYILTGKRAMATLLEQLKQDKALPLKPEVEQIVEDMEAANEAS